MNVVSANTAAEEAFGIRLPSRKHEDWKWTDLRRLLSNIYSIMPVEERVDDIDRLIASAPFSTVSAKRIVFINGRLDRSRSDLDRFELSEYVASDEHSDTIVTLNSALAGKGVVLRLSGNIDLPIFLLHLTTEGNTRAIATCNKIIVADGATATVGELHIGEGDYLAVHVTEYVAGSGTRLDRVKIEMESARATHLAEVSVSLAEGSVFRDFTLTCGAGLNRQNGNILFTGSGGDARISGVYLLDGQQHADTKLVVDHAVANCLSRELFKCVMGGSSRGIFQGKVIVRKDAQKTDGKQSSHALLLSETAEFDAKPELEIYADDVVCGHGATAGDIDHDHMFYLRSRGIPAPEARAMLITAFVNQAIEAVEHEGLRAELLQLAEKRLII